MPSSAIDEPRTVGRRRCAQRVAGPRARRRLLNASCRALDVVGSAVLLVVLAPLLGVIAIAIRLDSPGPALFRQRRLGRDREPFTVQQVPHDARRRCSRPAPRVRARTHQRGASRPEAAGGPYYKMIGDPRVTRFGRLLRRSSLDELPQLWNVLRGEMSLVGPRPPIPYEVEQYPPHWFARFAVKPGSRASGRSTAAPTSRSRRWCGSTSNTLAAGRFG